jgi:hypothetical protein
MTHRVISKLSVLSPAGAIKIYLSTGEEEIGDGKSGVVIVNYSTFYKFLIQV